MNATLASITPKILTVFITRHVFRVLNCVAHRSLFGIIAFCASVVFLPCLLCASIAPVMAKLRISARCWISRE